MSFSLRFAIRTHYSQRIMYIFNVVMQFELSYQDQTVHIPTWINWV